MTLKYYYHAVVKNQVTAIISQSRDIMVDPSVDFITGDMGVPALGLHVLDIAGSNTRGTALSQAASSGATRITVTSLTGMDGNKVTVKLNSGVFHWAQVVRFKTLESAIEISPALPSAADSGNQVISTAQLNGSTAFTIGTNFKTPRIDVLVGNTHRLFIQGIEYEGYRFAISQDLLTRALWLKDGILNTLIPAADKYVPDKDGELYLFPSDKDFAVWFNRLRTIHAMIMTGERYLRESISAAPNTAAAMAAINDARP